ncbi:MAG: 23S rRNA (adenine(2503)-C(2))-methyltransferase RlmN [Patescibacteria group bacterium]|nr:23S rRNA (adenine(2503)-C(2))-methyltransferase RlmN [Patescibacteria group bacterium]
MNLTKLGKIFADQEKFRIKQAEKLIFKDLISDWKQASVFSLALREKLQENLPLAIENKLFISKDGRSAKAIIFLEDGFKIETALMAHGDGRNTACLSCQVGCPLACKFCISGTNFKRNLTLDEILSQALFWARYLKEKKIGRLSNIVFMGSGEPFLNYQNVFQAISYLNSPDYFDISARKISISTIGVSEGIRKMVNEKYQVNLAVSLHFVDERTRVEMMPATKKYSLKKMWEAIDYYIKETNRKVMFEYILIKGLNDSKKEAEALALIMKKPLYAVNLIRYNKTGKLEPSETKAITDFRGVLRNRGVEVVERHRFNEDIFGACGQLIGK